MPGGSQFWVFTVNNPVAELGLLEGATYQVWQLEKGKNGTKHYQGYVEFLCRKTLAAMKRLIYGAHWEMRKGTAVQARDYCMKEDSRLEGPWELGHMSSPEQGTRTDISKFQEDCVKLDKGAMWRRYPVEMTKYWRMYNDLVLRCVPPRRGDRQVILCYGSAGTGKTLYARSLVPLEDMSVVPVSKDMWFDGVGGARLVVLDDFTGAFPLDRCLQLLHEWPEKVAVKGGFVWWNPEIVVITTNTHPMEWYDWEKREVQKEALGRRFTRLVYFSGLKNYDLSTLSVVPGCVAKWEQGPMLAEQIAGQKKDVRSVLMAGEVDRVVARGVKRGADGLTREERAKEKAVEALEDYIDLRKTQEVLPVSYYDVRAQKAATMLDSDEEGTGE